MQRRTFVIHFKLIFLAKVSPASRLQPGEEGLPYEKDGGARRTF